VSERISFVIPKEMRKSLRELQEVTGEDQSTLLRKLIDKGLAETRMDIAVERYVKEKSSLAQASTIAGVSLWKFLDELRTRNVALKYSMADAELEIDKVLQQTDRRRKGSSLH
jgi:predicted HTH domain antitoxin